MNKDLLDRAVKMLEMGGNVDKEGVVKNMKLFAPEAKIIYLDNFGALARDRARARARDLDIDLARARARDLDLDLARARARAHDLDRALARALARARDLDFLSWMSLDCYLEGLCVLDDDNPKEFQKQWMYFFQACEFGLFSAHMGDDKTLLLTPIPEYRSYDQRNRLHNETGPALTWLGEYMYYWHGINLPERAVLDIESYSVKEILEEKNSEARRALCSLYGWDKILKGTNSKLIDSDPDPLIGQLWQLEDCQVLYAQNGTPEAFTANGMEPIYKWYAIPFFRNRFRTALEAGMSTYPIPNGLQRQGVVMTPDLYRELSKNRT